jgi:hypothetical protein
MSGLGKYYKTNNLTIDSINIEDFILKYNTASHIELEVIFNCDMVQILNTPYTVTISLVNIDNTITYASFNPTISDFSTTKKTIPTGGLESNYTSPLSYFMNGNNIIKYISNNHFNNNNSYDITSPLPLDNGDVKVKVEIDTKTIFSTTRKIKTFYSQNTPSITDTVFNFSQNYSLILNNYYTEYSDLFYIKINNSKIVSSLTITPSSINNNYILSTPFTRNQKIVNNISQNDANTDFESASTVGVGISITNPHPITTIYKVNNTSVFNLYVKKLIELNERKIDNSTSNIVTKCDVSTDISFNMELDKVSTTQKTINFLFSLFTSSTIAINDLEITKLEFRDTNGNVQTTEYVKTTNIISTHTGNGQIGLNITFDKTNDNDPNASYILKPLITLRCGSNITTLLSETSFVFNNN